MDVGACFLWVAHNRARLFRCRSSVSPDLRQGIAGFLFLDRNKKWTPAGPEAPQVQPGTTSTSDRSENNQSSSIVVPF